MSNLSITPMRAYYDTRMSPDDIILLGIICNHTDADGYCFPSLQRMSLIFSPIMGRKDPYDISSISKKIARLESFGYVIPCGQRKTENGSFKSNGYKIILDALLPLEFDRRKIQAPLENSIEEIQATVENPQGKNQTNDPIERPKVTVPVPSENQKTIDYEKVMNFYRNAHPGGVTQIMVDIINSAIDEYPADWIIDAMKATAKAGVRSWNYTEKILDRWKVEGKGDHRHKKTNGRTYAPAENKLDLIAECLSKPLVGGLFGKPKND